VRAPCEIKIKGSGQECPLHTCRADAARVELVPFPVKVKINVRIKIKVKGDGQECPSHTIRVKGNFNDIPCLF
jgi:hypothetical protein